MVKTITLRTHIYHPTEIVYAFLARLFEEYGELLQSPRRRRRHRRRRRRRRCTAQGFLYTLEMCLYLCIYCLYEPTTSPQPSH